MAYTDERGKKVKGWGSGGDPVPIKEITIMWHEGTNTGPNLEGKKYRNWHEYQNALKRINDDNKKGRPYGTYTKTKGRFVWADGTTDERRIDLGPNDFDPDHIDQSKTNRGRRMYVGDYYRQTLRDGRLVDVKKSKDNVSGKKWVAYDPPRYVKSKTGRELGTGHRDDRKMGKDGFYGLPKVGWKTTPPHARGWNVEKNNPDNPHQTKYTLKKGWVTSSGHSSRDVANKELYLARKTDKKGYAYEVIRNKQNTGWKVVYKKHKGKASRDEQPEKVLGSYSTKGHRPQKQKPYSSKQGPGSGWHGQIARHRMAAMKGRRG